MSRFTKLACLLALTTGIAAVPAYATIQYDGANSRPDAPCVKLSTTTANWGCCYIYFGGRWICIPCG